MSSFFFSLSLCASICACVHVCMCVCEWEKRRCLRISFYYLIIHLIIIFVFWCTKLPLVTWTKGLNHKIVTCLSVCLLNRLGYFFFFWKSFFLPPLSLFLYVLRTCGCVCVTEGERKGQRESVYPCSEGVFINNTYHQHRCSCRYKDSSSPRSLPQKHIFVNFTMWTTTIVTKDTLCLTFALKCFEL